MYEHDHFSALSMFHTTSDTLMVNTFGKRPGTEGGQSQYSKVKKKLKQVLIVTDLSDSSKGAKRWLSKVILVLPVAREISYIYMLQMNWYRQTLIERVSGKYF
jgi:hypothetical protein